MLFNHILIHYVMCGSSEREKSFIPLTHCTTSTVTWACSHEAFTTLQPLDKENHRKSAVYSKTTCLPCHNHHHLLSSYK